MRDFKISDAGINRIARNLKGQIDESEEEGELGEDYEEAEKDDSPDMRSEIIEFFDESPDPDDELLHEWAESKGYDTSEVETEVYKLATKYVRFITTGRAKAMDITKYDVDEDELRMGIEVELEHNPDREIAERIALDHLAELPDYYTKLKEMEG